MVTVEIYFITLHNGKQHQQTQTKHNTHLHVVILRHCAAALHQFPPEVIGEVRHHGVRLVLQSGLSVAEQLLLGFEVL